MVNRRKNQHLPPHPLSKTDMTTLGDDIMVSLFGSEYSHPDFQQMSKDDFYWSHVPRLAEFLMSRVVPFIEIADKHQEVEPITWEAALKIVRVLATAQQNTQIDEMSNQRQRFLKKNSTQTKRLLMGADQDFQVLKGLKTLAICDDLHTGSRDSPNVATRFAESLREMMLSPDYNDFPGLVEPARTWDAEAIFQDEEL